jgi:hypothetical protein
MKTQLYHGQTRCTQGNGEAAEKRQGQMLASLLDPDPIAKPEGLDQYRNRVIAYSPIDRQEVECLLGSYFNALAFLERTRKTWAGKRVRKVLDKLSRGRLGQEGVYVSVEGSKTVIHVRELPLEDRLALVNAWELLHSQLNSDELSRQEIDELDESILRFRVIPKHVAPKEAL